MGRSRGMPGLVHIKKEDHLGMEGTRNDGTVRRKATSGLHAPPILDCIRASSEAFRDVKINHHHPLFKGCMYFHQGLPSHSCEKSSISRSANWQSDLWKPVVGAAAFFAEHVQLLQSWVFPRTISRTLWKYNKNDDEQLCSVVQ